MATPSSDDSRIFFLRFIRPGRSDRELWSVDTDGNGTIDLDLRELGASPNHKDIFLEIDYMACSVSGGQCDPDSPPSQGPKAGVTQTVVSAFKNAPVLNPDNTMGINLHIDVDDAIPFRTFLDLRCGGDSTVFDAFKKNPTIFGPDNSRRFVYHYAIFGHSQSASTTRSGCAEIHGNDFIVTLGGWNVAPPAS